jgi:ABC-type multidrug transport system fused ATPase/permease subunit
VALFGPYRERVTLVFVVIVVSSGLSVVGALLIKVVFDKALFPPGGPNIPLLVELVAALIAIPILTGVLNIVQTYFTNWVGNRVLRDLRDRLFGHHDVRHHARLVYLVAGLEINGGQGGLSAGTIVAFTTLQTRLLNPINQLLQVSVDVQSSVALFARVFEYLDLNPRSSTGPEPSTCRPRRFAARWPSSASGSPTVRGRARPRMPPRRRDIGRCVT